MTWINAQNLQDEIKQSIQLNFRSLYGGRHLCLKNTIRAPTPDTLRQELCFCDAKCAQYGDCCVDLDIRDKESERSYHCSQLGVTSRYFYAKMGCGDDMPEDDPTFARDRCLSEDNSHDANVTHLIDQPQFHIKSRILYKNIYCVLCTLTYTDVKHSRGDLYPWKQRYIWYSEEMTPDVWSKLMRTVKYTYDTANRQYIVPSKPKLYKFAVDAEEYAWGNITSHFNTRPCPAVPVTKTCKMSGEQDESYAKYCPLYTAYVHDHELTAYLNVHCALCNGVNPSKLAPGLPVLNNQDRQGKRGNMFNSYRNLNCKTGEVEVLNSMCLPVLCATGWLWNGIHCVSQAGGTGCFILNLEAEWVKFMVNGSVMLHKSKQIFNEYSNITTKDGSTSHVRVCVYEPVTVSLEPAQELVAEICLISSSVCLLLQLIVYMIIPPLRVSRPGKIIMSLSLTILLGHAMFLFKDDIQPGTYWCLTTGLLAHYFYLASFFWMLVMALDSCRCLAVNVFNSAGGPYLMIKYSTLAIFGPALIVSCSILYDGIHPTSRYAPRYGREVCWIGSRWGLMAFFVAPIIIILLTNFMLFVYTAYTVRRVQTRSEKFRTNPSSFKNEMVRLKLYIRLVVVLGLTWFFGILSSLTNMSWLWYPFFILGAAQGVFIFVAFTCKRKVWHELSRKIWRVRARSNSNPRTKYRFSADGGKASVSRTLTHTTSISNDANTKSKPLVACMVVETVAEGRTLMAKCDIKDAKNNNNN